MIGSILRGILQGTTTVVSCGVRCLVKGHDFMLTSDPGVLGLVCQRCGHRTPGWQVATEAEWQRAREAREDGECHE